MNDAARRQEFLVLMQRLEAEPAHVLHVAELALCLFDRLAPLHCLEASDRLLLEAAACLHDTGWSVARDGKAHHKESARLIRAHPWQHWSAGEVGLVAQVARYHRKSMPSAEHEEFTALNEAEQHRVRHLAALLRLGDALDRSHTQRIRRIEVEILPDTIRLTLASARPLDAELESAQRKGDLAKLLWRRSLLFERIRLPQPA